MLNSCTCERERGGEVVDFDKFTRSKQTGDHVQRERVEGGNRGTQFSVALTF
jgi:hypothetical protein